MATQIVSVLYQITNDARFRAWGLGISNALAAVGLTKAADSGQIDWGTVLRPGVASTVAGYEIWRFSDSLQATAPVFIKVEYGTGNHVGSTGYWITVGTGTDGAGTMLGPISTRINPKSTNVLTEGQTAFTYISGANNRIGVFGQLGAASSQLTSGTCWAVERTKDATGADTAEGILLLGNEAGGQIWRQQVVFPTGAGTLETTLGIIMPMVGTGANGVQIAVYPQFYTKGTFLNPGLNLLAYINANLSALTPTAITFYGATHTYLPLGTQCFQALARTGPTGAAGSAPLMRWE